MKNKIKHIKLLEFAANLASQELNKKGEEDNMWRTGAIHMAKDLIKELTK